MEININSINEAKNKFFKLESCAPDYVMLHIYNRRSILKEAQQANFWNLLLCSTKQTCFGMKIIWTTDIGENEIICTKGVRGSI